MVGDLTSAFNSLREAGPVACFDNGAYVVTSREAAEYVFRHPRIFSTRLAPGTGEGRIRLVPAGFDPPEHTRYRQILQPFFSPRAMNSREAALRGQAISLIEDFAARGECDVATDLAVPFAADVLLDFLGLPLADRERIMEWKDGRKTVRRVRLLRQPADEREARAPGERDTWVPGERGAAAVDECAATAAGGREGAGPRRAGPRHPGAQTAGPGAGLPEYLAGHIASRRRRPAGDDMLSQLIAGPGDDQMTDEELLGLSLQFIMAGLDPVISAISSAFAILAGRRDLRAMLAAHPEISADAADELLRFEGLNPVIPRTTIQQVELCGQVIPAGSAIQVALGAVGRDPEAHPDADTIDFSRKEAHIAFGAGPHRCVGSHLARMELRTVLAEWHRRIPDYELAPRARPRVTWPGAVAGTDSLPLVFPADTADG